MVVKPLLSLCNEKTLKRGLLATCAEAMTGAEPLEWVQLIPAGLDILALDGRKFKNPNPDQVVTAFQKTGLDLPIDWEHATELRAPKGKTAPAAGWIKALENRAGSIWGKVDWTPAGLASLKGRDYRYISPGFYHKEGEVVGLSSAGLTNKPALLLQALAQADIDSNLTEDTMDPKLLALFGLKADATLDQLLAVCQEALKAHGETSKALAALQVEAKKTTEELATARAQVPGLDKFVPRADYDLALARVTKLETDAAAEKAATLKGQVDLEIEGAMKAGKIAPATVDFYRKQCATTEGLELFREFVKVAPVVVPDQVVTGKPAGSDKVALSSEERAFIATMGLTEEEYRAGAM